MMNSFEEQIRSMNYAIKELRKELAKANETKNREWIEDCVSHITNLEAAKRSVDAMKSLQHAISMMSIESK